jgi:electron-transferring-flavoprotein dehydrogenase
VSFVPSRFQPPLPLDRLILKKGAEGAGDKMELDVLFVGAGPAGLAGAIELARLAKQDASVGELNIGVLEKAEALGEHSLSGAVVNPRALRDLFPDLPDADFPYRGPVTKEAVYLLTAGGKVRLPTPPTMQNHGNYVASLCEIVRWLGAKAEALGVNVFTGFPAAALLTDGDRVTGVRTAATGQGRDGQPLSSYLAPNDLSAKVTALSEGTRGMLAQAWLEWQRVGSENPQIFALGVKEIWETKRPLEAIVHTMGWPLPTDAFGGSFLYPLEPNLVALGIVVGLDYSSAGLDIHILLQQLKQHPLFRRYLEGGEMVEWGAKTIPEGGYYALPARRSGDGVVLLGDAAGLVDVPSLKGIHYAIQSGIYAARAIFQSLKDGDTSAGRLAEYDRLLNASYVVHDLYRTRNMRLAFKSGLYAGGIKASLMTLTGGRFPGGRIMMHADADAPRRAGAVESFTPDGKLTFSKVDAVFKAGNSTRDTIPSHLVVGKDVTREAARFYTHVCPAGVYEEVDGKLRVNAPNCVDCKATDVVGPRWTPREGGSGPKYKRM